MKRAHDKFNDRGSKEGREVHRLEEQERRDQRAAQPKQERVAADARVGDHRCRDESEEVTVFPSAVSAPAAEVVNAIARPPPHSVRDAYAVLVEWVLVAEPGLLAQAQSQLDREATCPCCGRRGRVVRVIGLEQWRRSNRRGFG